jgi:hypothetical protein
MEPLLRNTANASKFDNRVRETATDSSVGETVTRDGFHLARLLVLKTDGPNEIAHQDKRRLAVAGTMLARALTFKSTLIICGMTSPITNAFVLRGAGA